VFGPAFQYQAYAEPLDITAGFVYDPDVMDWQPSLPDFARAADPLVPTGLYTVSQEATLVEAPPDGWSLTCYPDFVFDDPRWNWPNVPTRSTGERIAPPDPPAVGPPGATPPLIERVPDLPERERRHVERVADLLNSLLRQGLVAQVRRDDGYEYTIHTGRYAEARNPSFDDGAAVGAKPGSVWCNTADNTVWVCVDETQGAAIWLRVTTS
jgi:hypothetical protein